MTDVGPAEKLNVHGAPKNLSSDGDVAGGYDNTIHGFGHLF